MKVAGGLVAILFAILLISPIVGSRDITVGNKTLVVYFPGDVVVVKANFSPEEAYIVDPAGKSHKLEFKEVNGNYVAEFDLKKNVVLGNYTVIADNATTEFFVDNWSIKAKYGNGRVVGNVSYFYVKPDYVEYTIKPDDISGRVEIKNGSFEIPVEPGEQEVILRCGNAVKEIKISSNLGIVIKNLEVNNATATIEGEVLLDGMLTKANLTYWFENESAKTVAVNGSFNLTFENVSGILHLKAESGGMTAEKALEIWALKKVVEVGGVYYVNDTVTVKTNFKPKKSILVNPEGHRFKLKFKRGNGIYITHFNLRKDVVLGNYTVVVDGIARQFTVDFCTISADFDGVAIKGQVRCYFTRPEVVKYTILGENFTDEGIVDVKAGNFSIPLHAPSGNYTVLLECGNAKQKVNFSLVKAEKKISAKDFYFLNETVLINSTFMPSEAYVVMPSNRIVELNFSGNGRVYTAEFLPEELGMYKVYADDLNLSFVVDYYKINASFNGTAIVGTVKWHFVKPEFVYYVIGEKKGKVEVREDGRFVIPLKAGNVYGVVIKCGNAIERIEIQPKIKLVAFDPVKKVIVVKEKAEFFVAKKMKEAKKFVEVEIPATEENLKKFNFSPDILNTTVTQKKIREDLIRVEVSNKLETWYRFSVKIPVGYRVKEIVGDDGRRIVNTVHINRTTGEVEGDLRWYVKNGTLYFYDDPIYGYNISLTPPQPSRSIAIELANSGTYSGAGQISAIVFPYSQGDDDATIATHDHAGRTEDNYGNDIDIDAGSKIAIRYYSGTRVREFGNPYYTYWLWWRVYGPLGDDYINQISRNDTLLNTVPNGKLESVIITDMQTPTWRNVQLNITQKLIIRDNNRWFATVYYIENVGSRTARNLRFFQGMDWNFRGSYTGDNAYYSQVDDVVYGYDSNAQPGDIQFGGFSSYLPSSQHDVSDYISIWDNIDSGSLTNSSTFTGDAGTALAWDFPSLAPGERIVIPIIWGLGYDYADMVSQINDGKSELFDAGILSIDAPANNSKYNPSTAGVVYFNATAALFGLVDAENLEVVFNVTKVGGGWSYQNTTYVNLYVPYAETSTVSFPLDLSSLPYGKYRVEFRTNLPNDQNTSNDAKWIYFYIVAFTVESDQQKTANPGSEVYYNFTSSNYFAAGRFDVNIISSTKGWATRLYNETTLVAEDSDGDGVWDTVNEDANGNGIPDIFLPYGVSYVNVSKVIPSTAPLGETDVTTLNFSSISSPDINDDVSMSTSTPQPPTEQKQFYLHPDSVMNTSKAVQGITAVEASTIESWYQSPPFASTFKIYGKVLINLWMNSSAAATNQIGVSMIKTDGVKSEIIGTNVSQLAMTTAPNLYTLSIPLESPVTFNRGEYFILRIDNQNTNDIHVFQSTTYDSNITFNTTTYVKVVELYSSDCISGKSLRIYANITDPIGSHDISSAIIRIFSENGTLAENGVMSINATDPSTLSLWKLFDYPTTLAQGNYTVNVTAVESNGVNYTASFELTCTTPITPRNVTARLSMNSSVIELDVYAAEDVSDIKLYWTKPENLTVTSMSGDFDGNGTSGNVYWWQFNTIAAGTTKHVYLTISGSGDFSMLRAFNVGIDPLQ